MTTSIEIIDTAVKIGLGALITGVITYVITKTNQSHEIKKIGRDEKVKLIRECALHLEHMESKINECIVESGESDYAKARVSLTIACKEAYSARSVANLLGSDKLLEVINKICENIESTHNLIHSDRMKMFDKIELISKYKKDTYPYIRDIYSKIRIMK